MAFERSDKSTRHILIPDNKRPTELPDAENFAITGNLEMATNELVDEVATIPTILSQAEFDIKLKELKDMLQTALELEHSTIPPYLCALYSIKPGTNLMPVEIIKSVVIEEMLHMIMVANLINGIGGKPEIGDKERSRDGKFVPDYPTRLPGDVDHALVVNLNYFSQRSIRTFWRIEHPVPDYKIPPELDNTNKGYGSIGEFYQALTKNIRDLEATAQKDGKTIFVKDTGRQVHAEHYYGAGGKLFTVESLDDAEKVIEEIVGQGEGTLGSIFSEPFHEDDARYRIFGSDVEEYAHYFRFKEIHYERFYAPTDSAHRLSFNKGLPTGKKFEVDWDAVCKMQPNPKLEKYDPNSPVYKLSYDFSLTYSALLDNLNDGVNGHPEKLREGIQLMYQLKYQAVELMNIPLEDGYMAGPTFQYIKK